MKGFKTTLGLGVVLIGLIGYIYIFEPTNTNETDIKDQVFAIAADDIDQLQVTAATGETTQLQKEDGVWKITEPVVGGVDDIKINALTTGLSTLAQERIVEDAEVLSQYGLDPPHIAVGFRKQGEQSLQHLLLGDRTPAGDDLYAKRQGDPSVFLVSSFIENTYNRTTFDLRDKSVLKFDQSALEAISITQESRVTDFVKKDASWMITEPIAARAEYSSVEGLASLLSSSEVQRFIETKTTDLSKYGLDTPFLQATVSGLETTTSLLIGSIVEGTRYAKDSSRKGIFTVGNNLVQELQKELSEFRRKSIFESRPFSATKFEIHLGESTMSFDKTYDENEQEIWEINGQPIDSSEAENPLVKLTSLRAESFLAKPHPSLDSPEMTVVATFDNKEQTETVSFVQVGSNVYVNRTDEPGSAIMLASAYEEVFKMLNEFN